MTYFILLGSISLIKTIKNRKRRGGVVDLIDLIVRRPKKNFDKAETPNRLAFSRGQSTYKAFEENRTSDDVGD